MNRKRKIKKKKKKGFKAERKHWGPDPRENLKPKTALRMPPSSTPPKDTGSARKRGKAPGRLFGFNNSCDFCVLVHNIAMYASIFSFWICGYNGAPGNCSCLSSTASPLAVLLMPRPAGKAGLSRTGVSAAKSTTAWMCVQEGVRRQPPFTSWGGHKRFYKRLQTGLKKKKKARYEKHCKQKADHGHLPTCINQIILFPIDKFRKTDHTHQLCNVSTENK